MQITFRKAVLISFGRKVSGGKAKFSAALTDPVKNAMGWQDIADWETSCTPKGRLIATRIELEPKPGMGNGKGVELDTTLIDSFEVIKIENEGVSSKKTKSVKTELRFNVHFQDLGGAAKLEKYLLTTGNEGSMNVVYEREPEQAELPEVDTKQGVLEEMVEDVKKKRAAKDVQ